MDVAHGVEKYIITASQATDQMRTVGAIRPMSERSDGREEQNNNKEAGGKTENLSSSIQDYKRIIYRILPPSNSNLNKRRRERERAPLFSELGHVPRQLSTVELGAAAYCRTRFPFMTLHRPFFSTSDSRKFLIELDKGEIEIGKFFTFSFVISCFFSCQGKILRIKNDLPLTHTHVMILCTVIGNFGRPHAVLLLTTTTSWKRRKTQFSHCAHGIAKCLPDCERDGAFCWHALPIQHGDYRREDAGYSRE